MVVVEEVKYFVNAVLRHNKNTLDSLSPSLDVGYHVKNGGIFALEPQALHR